MWVRKTRSGKEGKLGLSGANCADPSSCAVDGYERNTGHIPLGANVVVISLGKMGRKSCAGWTIAGMIGAGSLRRRSPALSAPLIRLATTDSGCCSRRILAQYWQTSSSQSPHRHDTQVVRRNARQVVPVFDFYFSFLLRHTQVTFLSQGMRLSGIDRKWRALS